MLGKSSWIKLIVWIISRATAVGMATSSSPPNISQAAKQRTGRIRFPPAMSEYRMDSEIRSVCGSGLTTDSSNAFVIAGCFAMIYSPRSNSVADPLATESAVDLGTKDGIVNAVAAYGQAKATVATASTGNFMVGDVVKDPGSG